jgi:hypothetical protein
LRKPVNNKADLMARMASAQEELMVLIDPLPEAIFAAPSTPILWSAKDHLMHLALWQAGILALLLGKNRWEAMGLPNGDGDDDYLNDLLYHAHKDKTGVEVKSFFEATHQSMLMLLDKLSEAELSKPYSHYGPISNEGDAPIYAFVAGSGFGHYEEHLPWIEESIARAQKST